MSQIFDRLRLPNETLMRSYKLPRTSSLFASEKRAVHWNSEQNGFFLPKRWAEAWPGKIDFFNSRFHPLSYSQNFFSKDFSGKKRNMDGSGKVFEHL